MKLVTSRHDGAPSSNMQVAQQDRFVLSSLATEGDYCGRKQTGSQPFRDGTHGKL